MKHREMLEVLGRAFAEGAFNELAPLLADDCRYESQYANRTLQGAQSILENMKCVHSNLTPASAYTFQMIELTSVLHPGISTGCLESDDGLHLCGHGLLLHQFGSKTPVAVVICKTNAHGQIASIQLMRDQQLFSLSFYCEIRDEDSAADLPMTVAPISRHTMRVSEIRQAFSGQSWESDHEVDVNVYIWRNADQFMQNWLPQNGYQVLESAIFEDCIGYRCIRRNLTYAVFMFAYGQKKTVMLDGEYCSKLAGLSFSKDSTVLVVYLNVTRYQDGDAVTYKVRHYSKNEQEPEMWRLVHGEGKPILAYFPRQEIADQVWQLMYAFNRENTDIYDCIMTSHQPAVSGCSDVEGTFLNDAFYRLLRAVHQAHGDMKLGYVRYNDVVYSAVPYVEGYGFYSFRTDRLTNRILEVICHRFDHMDKPFAELIKTDIREPDDLFSCIPALVRAVPLCPAPYERFAAKLYFDNGECRKYILPVSEEDSDQEVISFDDHVFTAGIWNSAAVVASHASRYKDYPDCGPAIIFKNGYYVAGTRCYLESSPYSEPSSTDEVIYEDQRFRVRKVWEWSANSIWEDNETGLLKVLLHGQALNGYGKSVFATIGGKRLTSLTFDLIDSFQEGLARVAINGRGYGYVDKNMSVVIPLKYDEADSFVDGKATVRLGERRFCIDKEGRELFSVYSVEKAAYQEIGDFSEGLCRVSILKLRMFDLAYHSDYSEIAGVWGYINERGEEVISPQYIYADDFETGIAFVARGEWTIDPKWDNAYNTGRYWTEDELWGAIDATGTEVIPCIFDEIKRFEDCTDYFMAHYGGWENGHWGVIDRKGSWVAEPIFAGIDYAYHDGLFAFYGCDSWDDDAPMGIYDIHQSKILFEPQFLDVDFLEDGDISVEVFDPTLGRRIEKIMDRNGMERFKSIYTSIRIWHEPYEVVIRENDEDKHGLIDRDGRVIVPCEYPIAWNGFDLQNKRFIFSADGKQGVMSFDGKTIIPPCYLEIHGKDDPFLTVRTGEKDNYLEGLVTAEGAIVIPAEHKHIGWCKDKKHFFCCSHGRCEMYIFEELVNGMD